MTQRIDASQVRIERIQILQEAIADVVKVERELKRTLAKLLYLDVPVYMLRGYIDAIDNTVDTIDLLQNLLSDAQSNDT